MELRLFPMILLVVILSPKSAAQCILEVKANGTSQEPYRTLVLKLVPGQKVDVWYSYDGNKPLQLLRKEYPHERLDDYGKLPQGVPVIYYHLRLPNGKFSPPFKFVVPLPTDVRV